MPSAAGLKTFAGARAEDVLREDRDAPTCSAATYHGVCALSTIATISAVRTAPLGNSHACAGPAGSPRRGGPRRATALDEPGATTPEAFVRRGQRDQDREDDRQQSLGCLEELAAGGPSYVTRAGPPSHTLERRRHDQSVHAVPVEQRDASPGPSTNAAVASASASIAVGATTVTLATRTAAAPVRGSRMWVRPRS